MNIDTSKLIVYYRRCYECDGRGQEISNVFNSKYKHLHVLKRDSWKKIRRKRQENKKLDPSYICEEFYIPNKYSLEVKKIISSHKREKRLLFLKGFVVGWQTVSSGFSKNRRKRICAPLIFSDAQIKVTHPSRSIDQHMVSINKLDINWNSPLLSSWLNDPDKISELEQKMDLAAIEDLDLNKLCSWLNDNVQSEEFKAINEYTGIEALEKLKNKRGITDLTLINSSALLIVDRPRSSRGIIHELTMLEKEASYSEPLNKILFAPPSNIFSRALKKVSSKKPKTDPGIIPGILSDAQKEIIDNATKRPLSQVIGPPGTGKSYTIASIALDRYLQGESVLIVSETDNAVDVLQKKLINDFGIQSNSIVRAGHHDHHTQLKNYISRLTEGLGKGRSSGDGNSYNYIKKIKKAQKEILKKEKEFIKASRKEVETGIALDKLLDKNKTDSWINRFKAYLKNRNINEEGTLYDRIAELKKEKKEYDDLVSKEINLFYERMIEHAVRYNRKALVVFKDALRARSSGRQKKLQDKIDFKVLLNVMPIWLCTLDSLYKALPFEKELFDLVLFDEATQCNIASCLPAIHRAKRAVIVGDPHQLRHVSFLSFKKQEQLQSEFEVKDSEATLNFREHGIIDLADQAIETQDAVVMLDEHYRSLPDIIQFSNERFYNNRLRIMTEKPVRYSRQPVNIIQCKGIRESGVNKKESEAILKKIKELITSQRELNTEEKLKIGVLSFFRDQAEYLQARIFDELNLDDIAAHDLRAGTPYAFQGEERDIMLISVCVDPESVKSTLGYLNRKDMFNVAVTRARSLQTFYTSLEISDIPKGNQLHDYFNYIYALKDLNKSSKGTLKLKEKYVKEVVGALGKMGFEVLEDYAIAGIPMDLVIRNAGNIIAIDLIGFPGEYEDVLHLERYKIFDRIGLSIFPLSLWEWTYFKERSLEKLKELCQLELENLEKIKLTAQSLEGHWYKILSTLPNLAKRIRMLELGLSSLGLEEVMEQVGTLLQSYQRFQMILEARLDPSELTFSRYLKAAQNVLLATVGNMEKIVLLTKSLPGNEFDSKEDIHGVNKLFNEQKHIIKELISSNNEATNGLKKITMTWGQTDTGINTKKKFETSLEELESLNKNVGDFGV